MGSLNAADWARITDALAGIRRDCASIDWDGEAGRAISERTISIVELVVTTLRDILLPEGTPPPEIVPESDGDICPPGFPTRAACCP